MRSIPEDRIAELMGEAITEAEKSIPEDDQPRVKVGAILADRDGNVLLRAHRNEHGDGGHAEFTLLAKAVEQNVSVDEAVLFVTLEPCTTRGVGKTPCAVRILESTIQTVYIGALDPNPLISGQGETMLHAKKIEVGRFPFELREDLESLMDPWAERYAASHLPPDSIYVDKQISELMSYELRELGPVEVPNDWDLSVLDLPGVLGLGDDALGAIRQARGRAYDLKYGTYTYESDVRGVSTNWVDEFKRLLATFDVEDLVDSDVLNVGVGKPEETEALFPDSARLTLVDIAPDMLRKAAVPVPSATAAVDDAEWLSTISDDSQDLYVSLRVYQSSFLDRRAALRAARRVLRQGGVASISIANGFLGEDGQEIKGLVFPGTGYVDIHRPFVLAEEVRREMTTLRFGSVGIFTGTTEIFISGRLGR